MKTGQRTRAPILWIVAIGSLFALSSCLPVPLGDPEKSKTDAAYVGAWTWDDDNERHLVVLRPWDERTYYVRLLTLSHQPGKKKAEQSVMKGWLTTINGQAMLTLQDAEKLATLPGEDEKQEYLILKLNLADDRLIATSLDPSFPPFEVVRSAEELERLVSQHMDNPKMWASESLNTRRATKQDREAFAEGLDRAIADNFAAE